MLFGNISLYFNALYIYGCALASVRPETCTWDECCFRRCEFIRTNQRVSKPRWSNKFDPTEKTEVSGWALTSVHPETCMLNSWCLCRCEFIRTNQCVSEPHWPNKFGPTQNMAVSGCTLASIVIAITRPGA